MVTIKFKKSAIHPLIDNEIYSMWLSNLKKQWLFSDGKTNNGYYLNDLEIITAASELILAGFLWDETKEGNEFWSDHYYKLLKQENECLV